MTEEYIEGTIYLNSKGYKINDILLEPGKRFAAKDSSGYWVEGWLHFDKYGGLWLEKKGQPARHKWPLTPRENIGRYYPDQLGG